MKKIVGMAMLLMASLSVNAAITDYSFTPSAGAYTFLSGATNPTNTSGADDGYYNSIPIGFTFNYDGIDYTTLSASTNGWLTLGNTIPSYGSLSSNNLTSGPRPVIAPLWDDHALTATTDLTYLTTGEAGSRICTVEWKNVKWGYNGTTAGISFQVKLYELDGKVEFVYHPEAGALSSPTASIGLASSGTGSGNFISIGGVDLSNPTISSTLEASSVSTKPVDGQTFSFVRSPMTYGSSDVVQVSGNVLRGSSNVKVLQIPVTMTGALTPLSLTKLVVNAEGTTDITKISNAKIYYTGNSSTFATTNLFGTVASPATTDFDVTGSQALVGGTNYFWLTFDVAADAADGSVLDAECKSITVNSEVRTPTNTDPDGVITIKSGMSGTKTVGATGNYTTINAAMAELSNLGVEAPLVLELLADYTPETSKISLNGFIGSSNTNTLTIRPAAGITTPFAITVADTALAFGKSVNNVIIDGRPGGTGTDKMITITGSSTLYPTICFRDDASNNIIRYCTVKGRTTGSTGVVTFGTTGRTIGNDNNTIEYCDITADGTNYPKYLIYSSGTYNKDNDGLKVDNNNLSDFFMPGSSDAAVYISSNSKDATVTNNKIFQSAARAYTGGNDHYGIMLFTTYGNSTVNNNIIGYANSTGTGTYTMSGSYASKLYPIYLEGTSATFSVQGNTISQISLATTSGGSSTNPRGFFGGITLISGNANIGNVTANTIGSLSANDAIVLSSSSGASTYAVSAINSKSTGTVVVSNNNIGGIKYTCSSASSAINFRCITIVGSTGSYTISNNKIGSADAKIIAGVFGSTTGVVELIGVENRALAGVGTTLIINNNAISSLYNYGNNSGNGKTAGVFNGYFAPATFEVKGNSISDLNATSQSCYGICSNSGVPSVLANKIFSLNHTGASSPNVYGISTSSGTIANNMITLGAGNVKPITYYGIYNTNAFKAYYNTVLINGKDIEVGINNSFAFYATTTSGTREYQNNIFINQRSNAVAGTAKHYAAQIGGTAPNPSGLVNDYNNYYIGGTGGVFGKFNNADVADLEAWKTAIGQDLNSKSSPIKFVSADSINGELKYQRITANAAVFNTGTPITGITTDFYGTTRPQYAQVDIGAYELVASSGLAESVIPAATALSQNYPNPFNPETTINFALAKDAQVNLSVFNAKGEVVKTLVNSSIQAGYHSVNFSAVGLNSGLYFYKLTTPENSFMKKMILVK